PPPPATAWCASDSGSGRRRRRPSSRRWTASRCRPTAHTAAPSPPSSPERSWRPCFGDEACEDSINNATPGEAGAERRRAGRRGLGASEERSPRSGRAPDGPPDDLNQCASSASSARRRAGRARLRSTSPSAWAVRSSPPTRGRSIAISTSARRSRRRRSGPTSRTTAWTWSRRARPSRRRAFGTPHTRRSPTSSAAVAWRSWWAARGSTCARSWVASARRRRGRRRCAPRAGARRRRPRPLGGRLPRAARLRRGTDGPRHGARGHGAGDAPAREAPAHLVPARAGDRVAPPGARGRDDCGGGRGVPRRRGARRPCPGVMAARAAATQTYLDFERPLEPLDAEIARLVRASPGTREGERLRRLRAERRRVQQELLTRLTPWERVQLSRHPDRPSALDYLGVLCRDLVELHGDRRFGEDGAIVGGLARFRGHAVVVVAQQRGRSAAERLARNFGMPRPEGYRKAIRLFELAERFRRPVITFVDTQGADPGIGAEERGQAEAIAASLRTLAALRAPVVSAVIGEGGSGG